MVGNEGYGYAQSVAALNCVDVGLCPTFSLYGQPRDMGNRSLDSWLASKISDASSIGLVGAKCYTQEESSWAEGASDIPGFIVDAARARVGKASALNASALMIDPSEGLRTSGITTTARDIAQFEFAAEVSYSGVRRLLNGLKPGMSEAEAASLLGFSGGIPLSYHIALGFGETHVNAGLGSPSFLQRLQLGDPVTFGFGLWGANIARTGFGVAAQTELPEAAAGYVENLCVPYLKCLKDWYEAMGIDRMGGHVNQKVKWFTKDPKFAVGLNPGHLIHLDEWPATPFYDNSSSRLKSGMFFQCDIIPAPGAPLYGIHTEDGIVLANENLRHDLEREFPKVAERIKRRRTLVASQIGIELPEDVLPLSSIQAQVAPFLLDAESILCL